MKESAASRLGEAKKEIGTILKESTKRKQSSGPKKKRKPAVQEKKNKGHKRRKFNIFDDQ